MEALITLVFITLCSSLNLYDFFAAWADNADACAKQYAGTGALKTDFTRSVFSPSNIQLICLHSSLQTSLVKTRSVLMTKLTTPPSCELLTKGQFASAYSYSHSIQLIQRHFTSITSQHSSKNNFNLVTDTFQFILVIKQCSMLS